jgi:putative PIG3 family NAD(P)H quinone oxidoreductase
VADVQAVTISSFGEPEVLRWGTVDDLAPPGPGEVAIDVVASAVNRADLLQRQGFYPPPPGASDIPGMECSGRVAAVGDGAGPWRVGDEVCALLAGGGYATRVVVPAGQVLPVPRGVPVLDAAALPEVACTVYDNLFRTAALRDGEVLLVHGGASGIGTFAIQLVRAALPAATVAVTAGSAAKLTRCRELGAQLAISYADEDFVARIRQETGGRGADVILDNMGASYLARNIAALAPDGRLAIIGMQGGTKAEVNLGALMATRAAVYATSLRSRPLGQKAAIVAGVRDQVWPLIESGAVRPVIDRVVAMSDAAQAHRVVAASGHVGKVLLATGA